MMAHSEVYLRCPQLANASRVLGNLGDDILSKTLPADRPGRPSRSTAGLVLILRANSPKVFKKKYFPLKNR